MSTELVPIHVEHNGAMWPLWQSAGSKEPLAKDLDVARWLEYRRERDIRQIIERYTDELGEVSRHRTAKPGSRGGRPEEGYLLTEEQALFIAAKSETPKATQVLKAMIAVFLRARDMMRGAAPAFSAADVDRIIDATAHETAHETVRQLTQDAGTLTAIAQKVRALLGPLTAADKRRAAREALELWPHLSDRTLAQRAGVGRTLLAEVRAELGAAPAARLGEDGKTRRLPGTGRGDQLTTDDVLARFGLVITQGLTTPKREGKKPREVWHVSGTRKEWAPILKAAKGFWFRPEQHWTFYTDPREALAAAFAGVTLPEVN